MGNTKTLQIGLLLFMLSLSAFTCKDHKQIPEHAIERQMVDSLDTIYLLGQAFVDEPSKVIRIYNDKRKTIKDSVNYYRLTKVMAMCYIYRDEVDYAFSLSDSILNFCKRNDSTDTRIRNLELQSYIARGIMYLDTKQPNAAINCYNRALIIANNPPDKREQAIIYTNLGSIYLSTENYIAATDTYRKALSTLDALGFNRDTTQLHYQIYGDLGKIYTSLENFPLADYYLSIMEADFHKLVPINQFLTLSDRAYYYELKKEYRKALSKRKRAYDIVQSFENFESNAAAEANLAEVYLHLNQPDSAKVYLDKSATYLFQTEDFPSETYYLEGLFAVYYMQKKNLEQAEYFLSKRPISRTFYPSHILSHLKLREELNVKRNNYQKAYEYSKKAGIYKDSIASATVQNNIAETALRYQQDTTLLRRDIMISQKEQQVSQLKNTNLIIILLLVILFLTAIIVFYNIRRRKNLQYNRQLATINSLRMENVRNRISPHYMLNVLNSVLPSLRKNEETTEPIKLLLQSIRGNLLVSEKMAVTLEEEVDIVKNYIALNQSTHPNSYKVEWNIASNVEMQTLLPSMIMQIPVENAIKYAFDFDSKDADNLIRIVISQTNDYLVISIQDNGVGFDLHKYSTSSKGTGSGLKILYKTIELLNMKNQHKILFDIKKLQSESPHGTQIHIEIPFEYKYEL